MDNFCEASFEKRIADMFSTELGDRLYGECQRLLTEQGMDELINKGVLVGFSGGADSVFLLSFLLEFKRRNSLKFDLVLCHVNHLVRIEVQPYDRIVGFRFFRLLFD